MISHKGHPITDYLLCHASFKGVKKLNVHLKSSQNNVGRNIKRIQIFGYIYDLKKKPHCWSTSVNRTMLEPIKRIFH